MATSTTLRRIGADLARPQRTIAGALLDTIQSAGDSLARWAWVKSYERAEAIHWPKGENQE